MTMLSAKSLHASGRISDKQMHKLHALRGTKSQKSKMAPFEQKTRDEGHVRNKGIGEMDEREINDRTVQDKGRTYGIGGRRSPPSTGGRAGPEGQLHVKHIDNAQMQKPKFPRSGDMRASNPKTGNTRMKGGAVQRAGNMYDVPSRNVRHP
jgi:hypothetical protein